MGPADHDDGCRPRRTAAATACSAQCHHAAEVPPHHRQRRQHPEGLHLQVAETVRPGQLEGPLAAPTAPARCPPPRGLPNSAAARLACSERGQLRGVLSVDRADVGSPVLADPRGGGQQFGARLERLEAGAGSGGPGSARALCSSAFASARPSSRWLMAERRASHGSAPRAAAPRRPGPGAAGPLTGQQQADARAAHEVGDQPAVAGPLGVPQRVHRLVPAGPPAGRDRVQLAVGPRLVAGEVGHQERAQEGVDAVVAAGRPLDQCRRPPQPSSTQAGGRLARRARRPARRAAGCTR